MPAKTGKKGSGKLRDYESRRDFRSTPEPRPKRGPRERDAPRFVVQEHSARRLHWDLRLEHDGVAVSWAIPNGIPNDPEENRKAVHVEDHPLEYMQFEGEIPAGEYGAGTVKIWDKGTYEVHKWTEGKIVFSFAGERLSGRYALFRAGGEKDWMIHRMDPPRKRETHSRSRSGRCSPASRRCHVTRRAGPSRSSGTASGRSPTAVPAG